jgi:hypothetical protein
MVSIRPRKAGRYIPAGVFWQRNTLASEVRSYGLNRRPQGIYDTAAMVNTIIIVMLALGSEEVSPFGAMHLLGELRHSQWRSAGWIL